MQKMVPKGVGVMVGATADPHSVRDRNGAGGTLVEMLATSHFPEPADGYRLAEMIGQSRVSRLLAGRARRAAG